MFSCCGSIQRILYNHQTHLKEVLLSTGALLVIAGIWKLYAPAFLHSNAANWAFLGAFGLCASMIVAFVVKYLRRDPRESTVLVNGLLSLTPPIKKEALQIPLRQIAFSNPNVKVPPIALWEHIFSYLDIDSLGRVQRVCSAFYNYAQKESLWVDAGRKDLPPFVNAPRSKDAVKVDLQFKRAVQKKEVSSYELPMNVNHIQKVFFVKDHLILTNILGEVQIWKPEETTQTWKRLQTFEKHLAFSLFAKEDLLFCGAYDLTLSVWQFKEDDQKWVPFKPLVGHTKPCFTIFYEDDTLFSGASGGDLKIWKLNKDNLEGECIQTLKPATSRCVNTIYHAKGLLFSGDIDGTIHVWNFSSTTQSFELMDTLEDHKHLSFPTVASLFYVRGFLFSVGSGLKIWKHDQFARWQCHQSLDYGSEITGLTYANGLLYTGNDTDSAIKVWKLNPANQHWESIQSYIVRQKLNFPIGDLYYSSGLLFFGYSKLQVLKANN